jgi:hypothetical protein
VTPALPVVPPGAEPAVPVTPALPVVPPGAEPAVPVTPALPVVPPLPVTPALPVDPPALFEPPLPVGPDPPEPAEPPVPGPQAENASAARQAAATPIDLRAERGEHMLLLNSQTTRSGSRRAKLLMKPTCSDSTAFAEPSTGAAHHHGW